MSKQLIDACATISAGLTPHTQDLDSAQTQEFRKEATTAPHPTDDLLQDDLFTASAATGARPLESFPKRVDRHLQLRPGTLTPEQVLFHTIRFLEAGIPSIHDSAVSMLRRFSQKHITQPGNLTLAAFEVASWLFHYSDVNRHIGNRSVAGEVIARCAPHLPALHEKALQVARELRPAILEQHNDVEDLIEAYRSLIHLFPEGDAEITEGVAMFVGLFDNAKSDRIQLAAQGVLASFVDQFAYLHHPSRIMKRLVSAHDGGDAQPLMSKGRAG